MRRRVKYISDFGVKRIGDVCEYDGQLASHLVNVDKVAEDTTDEVTAVDPDREYLEPGETPSDKTGEVIADTDLDSEDEGLAETQHPAEDTTKSPEPPKEAAKAKSTKK